MQGELRVSDYLRVFATLVACGLSISGQSTSAADESDSVSYRPVIGEPHPDFVLPNIRNNKPLRLSDYRGQKVLLIHFASW